MDLFGDLVVVIPGILGSRLVRREGHREVTVWDLSIKKLSRVLKEVVTNGLTLDQQVRAPDDGIEAVELFSYQLLPGFFGVDDYAPLIQSLKAAVSDQRQLVVFPYDWRGSNQFAAQRLETWSLDALMKWKVASGNRAAKLWLICHSMGGLVARYFCEHLGGAEHTRATITIGTPHRGSMKALDILVNGRIGPLDVTRMVRSLPSVYELLPLFPAIRVKSDSTLRLHRVADFFGLDPVTGEELGDLADVGAAPGMVELVDLDRNMLKRSLEFHAAIREPAEARMLRGEGTSYRQEAFFNRRQLTPVSACLNGQKLEFLNTYPYERRGVIFEQIERGDGTVPSFSAVPIEWLDSGAAIALAAMHAALPAEICVRDTIFNWLRPIDVRSKKGGSVDDRFVVELNVPPTIGAGEDLVVQASSLRPINLTVQLQHVEKRSIKTQPMALPGDDVHRFVTFRSPIAGVNRVTLIPSDRMIPAVSDYVFVIDFD